MEKRLPTIKEIAKALKISPSTVSRALHNHHSIGLRTKTQVQELAKALNYQPNQTAIFLSKAKLLPSALSFQILQNHFFLLQLVALKILQTLKNTMYFLASRMMILIAKKELLIQ